MDIHSLQGRAHAQLTTTSTALVRRLGHEERGQGSVEYVALIMLVGVVLTAAVGVASGSRFDLAGSITKKIKEAVDAVGTGGRS